MSRILVIALGVGLTCVPKAPEPTEGPDTSSGESTTGSETSSPTGSASGSSGNAASTSSGQTSGFTSGGGVECDMHKEEAACAAPCRWYDSLLFPGNGGTCEESMPSGVCVALYNAPETGCTGPCYKLWRATPEGLQVLEGEFCFEFPTDWKNCFSEERPECECGCVTPP